MHHRGCLKKIVSAIKYSPPFNRFRTIKKGLSYGNKLCTKIENVDLYCIVRFLGIGHYHFRH